MEKLKNSHQTSFTESNKFRLLGGGAILTWLARGEDTGGQFSLFEAKGIPGMEPPPHVHENEDETYYLLEGEMQFRIGKEEFTGKQGDFIFLPRNIEHEFRVLSKNFRCLCGIYPAGLEHYFDKLSVPHRSENIPPLELTPPSPEAMEMMEELSKQYGITYVQ